MLELIWVILSPLRYLFNINNNNNINNINNNKNPTSTNTIVYKNINKPNYIQGENEDSIPLQIKSLTYLFHRFKFYNLKPLLIKKIVENDDNNEEQGVLYDFDYFNIDDNNKDPSYNILINEKLDSIYNIHYFKNQFLNDPYKILVDYNKNKFRSLLILSNEPTNNTININYQNQIPINSNFKFLILNPINSINNYIDIIINNSNIYIEHKVNKKIKIEILKKIIKKQLKNIDIDIDKTNIDDSTIINFSKDDRAIIISTYVQKLAFHIQVQRLYKATLKKKAKLKTKSLSNRYSTNNLKNFDNINNYRKLKNKKSSLTLLPETSLSLSSSSSSSTTKINNNLSILNSNDDNDDDINYYSDNQDSQASSSTNSSINYLKLFTDDEKQACFKDIKLIVRICIERQRNNYI